MKTEKLLREREREMSDSTRPDLRHIGTIHYWESAAVLSSTSYSLSAAHCLLRGEYGCVVDGGGKSAISFTDWG